MKQLIIQVILLGVSIFGLVMMYLYAYYQDQDRKNRKKKSGKACSGPYSHARYATTLRRTNGKT